MISAKVIQKTRDMFHIANTSPQDRMLMAGYQEKKLFDIRAIDIFRLDTWLLEQKILYERISKETHLPDVLIDIVISYSGSTHADALALIGDSLSRSALVKISNQSDHQARKTMNKLLTEIAHLIKYPKPKKSETSSLSAIVRLAKKVVDYDDWPDESGGPRVADIFYAILMLAWPDASLMRPPDASRDVSARCVANASARCVARCVKKLISTRVDICLRKRWNRIYIRG